MRDSGELNRFSRALSIDRLVYPFAGSEASQGDREVGPELEEKRLRQRGAKRMFMRDMLSNVQP